MSITDELRAWACIKVPYKYGHQLTAIADRIDEAYKREVVKGLNEHQHGRDEGWDEAVALMEREYVKLPEDADGVPIHIGDVMECDGETFEVRFIRFNGEFWAMNAEGWNPAATCHHREPTVEDVLREFFSRYVTTKPKEEDDAIVSEYAEKLREVVEHDRD